LVIIEESLLILLLFWLTLYHVFLHLQFSNQELETGFVVYFLINFTLHIV
jgi:hypothetical protein